MGKERGTHEKWKTRKFIIKQVQSGDRMMEKMRKGKGRGICRKEIFKRLNVGGVRKRT